MSKKYFIKYGFTDSVSTPHEPKIVILDLSEAELEVEIIEKKLEWLHPIRPPYSRYVKLTDLTPLT